MGQPKVYAPLDSLWFHADFPVPHTQYRHLARLIVLLGISKETQAVMRRIRQWPVREVRCVAFTDKPVSMKYRSAGFKIYKRGTEPAPYLLYGSDFSELTWKQTLKQWLKKAN